MCSTNYSLNGYGAYYLFSVIKKFVSSKKTKNNLWFSIKINHMKTEIYHHPKQTKSIL